MATPAYPFTAFNFSVEINVPGIGPKLCNAAFSDCDGLDMTMDVKTIREGGNNTQQIRLIGAVNYGQLTLKRGMTDSFDLWDWFDAQQHGTAKQLRTDFRANAEVVLMAPDQKTERVRWLKEAGGCVWWMASIRRTMIFCLSGSSAFPPRLTPASRIWSASWSRPRALARRQRKLHPWRSP